MKRVGLAPLKDAVQPGDEELECSSWTGLLRVTGYISPRGLKCTLPGAPSRCTQVCHPEQNLPLFLALCLYKKKEMLLSCCTAALSAAVEEKNPLLPPNPEMGNSLGSSLGRALKSGGRRDGPSLRAGSSCGPWETLLQHQQRCSCFPARGGRQSQRVWEDHSRASEENTVPCLTRSPAWAGQGDAPSSAVVCGGLWGCSHLALANLACG